MLQGVASVHTMIGGSAIFATGGSTRYLKGAVGTRSSEDTTYILLMNIDSAMNVGFVENVGGSYKK